MPSPSDILCSRGKIHSNHNGNIAFGRIVGANLVAYQQATRFGKTRVVKDILQTIRDSGARFLKPSGQTWAELSETEAHKKISHAIRDTQRYLKGNTKKSKKLMRAKPKPQRNYMIDSTFGPEVVYSNHSHDSESDSDSGSECGSGCSLLNDSKTFVGTKIAIPQRIDGVILALGNELESMELVLDNEYPDEGLTFSAASFF